MEPIDVAEETGATSALRARAKAAVEQQASEPKKGPGQGQRPRVARETDFPITLRDPWTGETVHTWRITSRVLDGAEQAQVVRYATQLGGVPMDRLSAEDREWFRGLARAEIQIRAVAGDELGPDATPAARRDAFLNRLWSDPDLLGLVTRRLVEHEARFRLGDVREGEGETKFERLVVGAIEPA